MDLHFKVIGVLWLLLAAIVLWMVLAVATGKADELQRKPLRYLIGAECQPAGRPDEITEVGYDHTCRGVKGIAVKYVNAFDEKNSGRYGPYLKPGDTASEYQEGQIDPHGTGWQRNLHDQFTRARSQGCRLVEVDNLDSYDAAVARETYDIAQAFGFGVLAKNVALLPPPESLVTLLHTPESLLMHPAVQGLIVEKGAGTPTSLDRLRKVAGRPALPIWFVAHGTAGRRWALQIAPDARRLKMGVTWSSRGEYENSQDVARP